MPPRPAPMIVTVVAFAGWFMGGSYRLWTGTITWVRERTYGANWYQPRMARNSAVVIASGLSRAR
jgi:hypothetical protein